MTKPQLRSTLKLTLNKLSPDHWRQASHALCARLDPILQPAKTVLFYFPTPGEVDIGPAARAHLARSGRACLPRAGWQDNSITAHLIDHWGENLSVGRHNIREPAESAPSVSLDTLDVVIVPGLGFDDHAGRLGRGGGFYDRFLARPELRAWKVGVGLDEQVVAEVPREAWDVGMDALVTPTRTLVFTPR
jgi:5-formyltetrahydrofolate cyclo-ligase